MDHIIDMYDDKYYESQEDALDNAMALRRCAKKVARILDCNVLSGVPGETVVLQDSCKIDLIL